MSCKNGSCSRWVELIGNTTLSNFPFRIRNAIWHANQRSITLCHNCPETRNWVLQETPTNVCEIYTQSSLERMQMREGVIVSVFHFFTTNKKPKRNRLHTQPKPEGYWTWANIRTHNRLPKSSCSEWKDVSFCQNVNTEPILFWTKEHTDNSNVIQCVRET